MNFTTEDFKLVVLYGTSALWSTIVGIFFSVINNMTKLDGKTKDLVTDRLLFTHFSNIVWISAIVAMLERCSVYTQAHFSVFLFYYLPILSYSAYKKVLSVPKNKKAQESTKDGKE